MEDIEQWLSTDVVSWGLSSPEAKARAHCSPTQQQAPVFSGGSDCHGGRVNSW